MMIRVLLVDNDANTLARTQTALEQTGDYLVTVFTTGEGAVEYAAQNPVAVAVIGLDLRGMSGQDVIARLRQHRPNLRILIRAPRETDAQIIKAIAADEVIQGTYTARALARSIQNVLRAGQPTTEAADDTQQTTIGDSHAMRQYLETSVPGDDPAAFGEVLESLAPKLSEDTPHDTFNALVKTLGHPRPESSLARRNFEYVPPISSPNPDDENIIMEGASLSQEDVFARLAADEPPLPDLEDSGTIRDLIAITNPDFEDTPAAEVKAIPADLIDEMQALVIWGDDEQEAIGTATQVLQALFGGSEVTLGKAEHDLLQALAVVDDSTPTQPPTLHRKPKYSDLVPIPESVMAHLEGHPAVPDTGAPPPDSPGNSANKPPVTAPGPADRPTLRLSPLRESPRRDVDTAELALRLTQYSMDSAAHATILLRGGEVVSFAGALPQGDVHELATMIDARAVLESSSVQIKFATLPQTRLNYLLIATPTINNMILLMVFTDDLSLGSIRQQVRELVHALENEASQPHPAQQKLDDTQESALLIVNEPPETLPESLPAEPSEGLRAMTAESTQGLAGITTAVESEGEDGVAIGGEPEASEGRQIEAREALESQPAVDPATLTKYACAWILRDSEARLDPELVRQLAGWLEEIILAQHWLADVIDVQPGYISMVVSVPPKDMPSQVAEILMSQSAQLVLESRPALATGPATLWADAYYIVAPGRPLTVEEINRFIHYQRAR